jgi:hypothetical protein
MKKAGEASQERNAFIDFPASIFLFVIHASDPDDEPSENSDRFMHPSRAKKISRSL